MTGLNERRRIDWSVLLRGSPAVAKLAEPTMQASELAALAAHAMNPSPGTADRALRGAVEFARRVIQLERSAIFLLDEGQGAMLGTWGTDAHGETVDEHGLMYEFGDFDRQVFARAQAGFPWTIYEDCPLIAQEGDETRVVGRGWVAFTAILGTQRPLGILFNDSALSRDPIDEAKQARAAVLCSLLGRVLERCEPAIPTASPMFESRQPIARRVSQLLVRDPSLSCEALARELEMSSGRLARTFKREANTSIVDYRNELRLARFLERVDAQAHNLLDAALAAGFGSYAQFHRVFRARFGRAPRDYLLHARPVEPSSFDREPATRNESRASGK